LFWQWQNCVRASDGDEDGSSLKMRMREDMRNQSGAFFLYRLKEATTFTIHAERRLPLWVTGSWWWLPLQALTTARGGRGFPRRC
jgi:hypothetical protein